MSGQEHVNKPNPAAPEEVDEVTSKAAASTEERDAEVDALLDEIDDVLETNAEEFVAAFVQKGGQ
jgi:prokaryotic ubiquitin-like protein Pup